MDNKTILNYLKDHYRKEDKAELIMEQQINNDILLKEKINNLKIKNKNETQRIK